MRTKFLFFVFVFSVFCLSLVIANPNGAEVTLGDSSRGSSSDVGNDTNAYAGNVTELNLYSDSVTSKWQGYYGNVSGVIKLANSNDDVMYNWSLAAPTGQVYAANSSSVTWSSIDCFNMAADVGDLEDFYNINSDASDGVDETFSEQSHPAFNTAGEAFAEDQCYSVSLFNNAGVGTFTQVLLADGGVRPVFTSIISDDTEGFDGNLWDFQMIVLEDGTDETASTYYFWVEIN